MRRARRAAASGPDVPARFSSAIGLGKPNGMPLGTSIFLIAVGAILRYAVTASVDGINLQTVGLILIIVGIVGLVLSIFYMSPGRRGAVGRRDRVVERDPYDEPPVLLSPASRLRPAAPAPRPRPTPDATLIAA